MKKNRLRNFIIPLFLISILVHVINADSDRKEPFLELNDTDKRILEGEVSKNLLVECKVYGILENETFIWHEYIETKLNEKYIPYEGERKKYSPNKRFMTIENLRKNDTQRCFSCQAINSQYNISSTIKCIFVNDIPTKKISLSWVGKYDEPIIILKSVGKEAIFPAKFFHNCNEKHLKKTWYYNNMVFSTRLTEAVTLHYYQVMVYKYRLSINAVVYDMTGNYKCKIVCEETKQEIVKEFRLEVIAPHLQEPIFTEHSPNQTVNVGDKFQLQFDLSSDQHPIIRWYHNPSINYSVNDAFKINTINDTDPRRYIIENASISDGGIYLVTATNLFGTRSIRMYVNVKNKTDIGVQKIHQKIKESNIVLIVIPAIIVLLCIGLCIFCYYHKRVYVTMKQVVVMRPNALYQSTGLDSLTTQQLSSNDVIVALEPLTKSQWLKRNKDALYGTSIGYLPRDKYWDISSKRIELCNLIGEGAFGQVYKAYLKPKKKRQQKMKNKIEDRLVAVKRLKDGANDEEVLEMVKEIETMKVIGCHQNVLSLIGQATECGRLLMIMEYAPYGNLQDFLRNRRPQIVESRPPSVFPSLCYKDLVSFSRDIAMAMEHLENNNCIHRDLAARNILVSDNMLLKVADFGMSRRLYCDDEDEMKHYYRVHTGGRVPVRWMPPEVLLHGLFTHKADVWSYGVVLWEICTLGGNPYVDIEISQLAYRLLEGKSLAYQPYVAPYMCDTMQTIMASCLEIHEANRPSFHQIALQMGNLLNCLTGSNGYINLDDQLRSKTPDSQYFSMGTPSPSYDEFAA